MPRNPTVYHFAAAFCPAAASLARPGWPAPELAGQARLYSAFTRWGSFPFILELMPDAKAVSDYLDGLLNTILLKDVMVRQHVANAAMLRDVVAFILTNVGSPTAIRRIANTLASAGRHPSPNTVESYLTGLINAYVIYPLRAFDVKGLRHLAAPAKYYAVDPGLRAAVIGNRLPDTGHLLENAVFLELRRRHGQGGTACYRGRYGDFGSHQPARPAHALQTDYGQR
jgi:predicted AAA+ superfamily ATPase